MVVVARLTWARCGRQVAEFAVPESASPWARAERVMAKAWQPALPACCAADPDRHSRTHASQKQVPRVLNRNLQLSQSAPDSAHSTIAKNSSNAQGWGKQRRGTCCRYTHTSKRCPVGD